MVRHQLLSGPLDHPRGSRRVAWALPARFAAQAAEPRSARASLRRERVLDRRDPVAPIRPRRPDGLHGRSRLGLEPAGMGLPRRRPVALLDQFAGLRPRAPRRAWPARPAKATYFPSHIHYEGAVRQEMTAAASFTFALDRVENPLSAPFVPEKRWTCWSSGKRSDWFEVDFGVPRKISGFDLFFFDDSPSGECRPPASFEVQVTQDRIAAPGAPITSTRLVPERPGPGENRVRFEPVVASRFRFQFRHAGDRFYTGLYGVRPIRDAGEPMPPETCPLEISGDKFITKSDILVSIVRVHNPTSQVQTIYVDPTVDLGTPLEYWDVKTGSGLIVRDDGEISGREPRSLSLDGRKSLLGRSLAFRFRYAVLDDPPRPLKVAGASQGRTASFAGFARPMLDHESSLYRLFGHHIQPGKTKVFKAAFEIRPDE